MKTTTDIQRSKKAEIMDAAELVGKRIRECRNANGLRRDELADRVHISDSQVTRYETGKCTPSIECVLNFAKALGVGVEVLLQDYMDPTNAGDDSLTPECIKKVRGLPENRKKSFLSFCNEWDT